MPGYFFSHREEFGVPSPIDTLRWSQSDLAEIGQAQAAAAPAFTPGDVVRFAPSFDVWDAWPLADPAGYPVPWNGGELWFALAAPALDDPESRHSNSRIHHFHRIGGSLRHLGQTLPQRMSPGSREWSGSAVLEGGVVTLYFTATGTAGEARPSFLQRLFAVSAPLGEGDAPFSDWSGLRELVRADEVHYRSADEADGVPGQIKAFRDPATFRAADGADYLLFTGSSAARPGSHDGVIGLALKRADGSFAPLAPLVEASGVNNELERPHIVHHGGRLYLFWSTQRGVFAPGIIAPTGLYGAVGDTIAGPWRLLNGHGLVLSNPPARPTQAYSWWVLPDLSVASFVDYWGAESQVDLAADRRRRFGGTFAPFVTIVLDGATAHLAG